MTSSLPPSNSITRIGFIEVKFKKRKKSFSEIIFDYRGDTHHIRASVALRGGVSMTSERGQHFFIFKSPPKEKERKKKA